MSNSSYYSVTKTDSMESYTAPTTLPESWNYKQGDSQSSTEGVSPPPSAGIEGERESKDDFHLQNTMEQLKISNEGRKKQGDVSDGEKKVHRLQNPSQQHEVDELHARIQRLEAELRRMPDRREVHVESIVPHYQTSLPNYYGSSPHSGELIRGSNYSGPLPPPHQYPQTSASPIPVETGFYHPCK